MTLALPNTQLAQAPATTFDLVIVGGGLVGATLAAALGHTAWRVALVDARNPLLGADGRASALALGTVRFLQKLGVWSAIPDAAPMHHIRVSDGDWGYAVRLAHTDIAVEALGYVVPNQSTLSALYAYLESCPNISRLSETPVESVQQHAEGVTLATSAGMLHAAALIAADGARSRLREQCAIPFVRWGYGQSCIVSTVTTEQPHHNTAYERFQPSGPFAILPQAHPHRCCVVWTVRNRDRDHLMSLDDAAFIAAIQPAFGHHLGAITAASPRASYQPQRLHCRNYVAGRIALVGDAAHTTHPLGGQGVNLGMRDVAALASLLRSQTPESINWAATLKRYQRLRQLDNRRVLWATDIANRTFSNRLWPLLWARRASFAVLNHLGPLKRLIMRHAMGLHCEYPLDL